MTQAAKKDTESIVTESSRKGNCIKETGSIFQRKALGDIAKKIEIKDRTKNNRVSL